MIPVTPQEAPEGFEENVRILGLKWLMDNSIPLDGPAPPRLKWNALWTQTMDYTHEVYGGVCSYLACYLELATGEVTIDHFVSKKAKPSLAFDWNNYRLASLGANRIKGEKKVLDPFEVNNDWFQLEMVSGRIFANPNLAQENINAIRGTIKKLGLDNERCRKMRARHFEQYMDKSFSNSHLKKINPLVYREADRQKLLRKT